MKKIIVLLFIAISIMSFGNGIKEVKIGVVYDGDVEENKFIGGLIEKEIQSIVGADYTILFPKDKQLVDDFNKDEIEKNIIKLLNDDDVDIVITAGILGSFIAMNRKEIEKPLFAPFVHLELKDKKTSKSGIKNLNYLSSSISLEEEFKSMQKIANFSKLTIIIGEEIVDTIPNIFELFLKDMKKYNFDFEYEFVTVGKNVDEFYKKLENVEAVSIGPMKTFSKEEKENLYKYINSKKIPSFSILGTVDVKEGLLAGYSYEKDTKKRIRTLAVHISRMLSGEKVENLPVEMGETRPEMILNMDVVEETGLWPDWQVISSSKLINFSNDNKNDGLNLIEVVDIALENNPELKALKKEVKIAEIEMEKSSSDYKPNLSYKMSALQVDEDRAKSKSVPYAERTLDAELNFRQILFSSDINANIDIKKQSLEIKKGELKQKECDLILETSEAYFNILKAQAYAKIQKNSLELTKSNLEIAKSRKAAGISGASDIYRWESELANSVSNLIGAMLKVSVAKTNLKRIMNSNQENNIKIKTMNYSNKEFITSNSNLMRYIENRKDLNLLTKYLTKIGYKNSPKVNNVENALEIQKILYKNRKQKRYMPTLALDASYKYNDIAKAGKGEHNPNPSANDKEWSVGIGFVLPLYEGGDIKNNIKISKNEIENYELKLEALKKGIEQEIITYTSYLVSDFARIKNANIASESANKALILVSDAYFKGVVSISELMDAQTATISADEYKETVVYDFLISLMRAEKSAGVFFFRMDEKEKSEILGELIDL